MPCRLLHACICEPHFITPVTKDLLLLLLLFLFFITFGGKRGVSKRSIIRGFLARGGAGPPLYRLMLPQRVCFLLRFDLKTCLNFAYILWFSRELRVSERICHFNSKSIRKKEQYANSNVGA